jgi:hypothetical protein
MTDSGGLHDSLAAMGFLELGFAFAALLSYCLLLNGALGGRMRAIAAGCALACASVLVAMTDPWMNGMILVAIGVAGIGVFVAIAWAVSLACGVATTRQPQLEERAVEVAVAEPPLAAPAGRRPPPTPAHSS